MHVCNFQSMYMTLNSTGKQRDLWYWEHYWTALSFRFLIWKWRSWSSWSLKSPPALTFHDPWNWMNWEKGIWTWHIGDSVHFFSNHITILSSGLDIDVFLFFLIHLSLNVKILDKCNFKCSKFIFNQNCQYPDLCLFLTFEFSSVERNYLYFFKLFPFHSFFLSLVPFHLSPYTIHSFTSTYFLFTYSFLH